MGGDRRRARSPTLAFAVPDAGRLEHAAAPTLRFALRDRRAAAPRSARSCSTSRSRSRRARRALRRAPPGPAVRAVRRPRGLGHDAADAAVDAHDARRSRRSRARPTSTCSCRARTTSRSPATRYLDALADGEVPLEFLFSGTRLLLGRGRPAADRAHLVGPRGRVPAAGRGVARDDGPPLPRQRLAAAATGTRFDRARAPTRRATRCRRWDAVARRAARRATRSRRMTAIPCARSPTPCSTRATCCGPTGARR